MNEKEMLSRAKDCLEKVWQAPYPETYEVGAWWRGIQEKNYQTIQEFDDASKAILYAQNGANSGFDHREKNIQRNIRLVLFRLRQLERNFPGFFFQQHQHLCESPVSDPATIVELGGVGYSNIFLCHANYYLRTMLTYGGKLHHGQVLEIGGGYGALARVFKIMGTPAQYFIIDLPESLFYAQVFLQMNFPDADIRYLQQDSDPNLQGAEIILVPVQSCHLLDGLKFDFVINTGSLQEMPDASVLFWMDFIQNRIHPEMFYSLNYFLNDKTAFNETSRDESNIMCPVLDQFWRCDFFQLSPEYFMPDSGPRNWLELIVRRVDLGDNRQEDEDNMKRYSQMLRELAHFQGPGTNDWFENMWMAFWCDRQEETARELLAGIAAFKQGQGHVNYNPNGTYGEEIFYQKYIDSLVPA